MLRELCLQNLPPEIVSIILGFVSEDELWRVRNLCHAFKAVYESSVRLKLLRLLPHIKSLITAQMETVENSMFSQEQLRLSQARKMLLLKYTYREALMFTAMVWRQSFDPGAWSAVCHSASRVLREFYSLADGAATWARILDFSSFYHRLQAWYAFQNTYTAQIEPLLAEDPNAETVPFSVQVVDVLECALFSNWESSIELSPSPRRTRKTSATPSEPRFDVEYWMRMRGEESRRGGCRGSAMLALTAFLDRADGTRPSQRAALLRFLRRAVADNTLAEFNRILDELEPLEVNVARSHSFAIPDQMVAEMSRVYAKVFQEYPQPWPSLRRSEMEPGYRLTRHADYDMTQSQTQVRLSVRGVPQHLLPLSWTQESLRGAVRLAPPRRPPQAPARPARIETPRRPRKGPSNVLTIETTRQERRDRFLKSSITVRGLDQDLKITRRTKCFKLL